MALTADPGLRYRILTHLGIVELYGGRAPDLPAIIEVFNTVVADPAFRPGFGFLFDRRELEPIAPELLQLTVTRLSREARLAGCKVAVVVRETEHARAFHLSTVPGGAPFMLLTFDDGDAARLWLSMKR